MKDSLESIQAWDDWAERNLAVHPVRPGTLGDPRWEWRNLIRLLTVAPALALLDPDELPVKAQRMVRWLCVWDLDTVEGVAAIVQSVAS